MKSTLKQLQTTIIHQLFALLCMYAITKICLYNTDPLKPHFYIIKLGFTGVYNILLISALKHRLWVFVRTSNGYTQFLIFCCCCCCFLLLFVVVVVFFLFVFLFVCLFVSVLFVCLFFCCFVLFFQFFG